MRLKCIFLCYTEERKTVRTCPPSPPLPPSPPPAPPPPLPDGAE